MPQNAPAWYALAQCLVQQGKEDEARKALKRGCDFDPFLREKALKDELLAKMW